jgi:hypothetical protein
MQLVIFVNTNHLFISGLCLKHLNNLNETVDGITIITPNIDKVKNFYRWCGIDQISFLSDSKICNILDIPGNSLDWIIKQYAILNLDKIIDSEQIVNIDADIIFNTEVKLTEGNHRRFYLENEYYQPYFDTIFDFFRLKKILPIRDSFISDFMIFDSKLLAEMRASSIAFDNYNNWRSIVDKNMPTNLQYNVPAISEYETYGTWLYANYPELMIFDRTNSTYEDNNKFHRFTPTPINLEQHKTIISLRQTYDTDIDWSLIYPSGWEFFK